MSVLNVRHGIYALTSLVSIGVTELYIRLLALGVLSDPRIVFGG